MPCAAALWQIGGEAEAPAVLDVLLQAMAQNPATANHVVACLERMGHLAPHRPCPCSASNCPGPDAAADSRASTTTRPSNTLAAP